MFVCAGVGVAIWQLHLMKKGFSADHERRKKQATIEFYTSISKSKEYIEALNKIDAQFPDDQVIQINDIKDDRVMKNAIRVFLSYMEHFCVGLNTDIYDLPVFERMAGLYTRRWYDKLKNIIDNSRTGQNPIRYMDFQKAAALLEEERNKRFHEEDRAKIKNKFE
jgi:hypothetical protein